MGTEPRRRREFRSRDRPNSRFWAKIARREELKYFNFFASFARILLISKFSLDNASLLHVAQTQFLHFEEINFFAKSDKNDNAWDNRNRTLSRRNKVHDEVIEMK